jgi:hypothetical protein
MDKMLCLSATLKPQKNIATVRSSIPITGWVLDDVGIESVKLYLKTGNQLDFIGDAVLVEGARTDVEAAYPGYPNNYQAGWGYMLLTNFLPNNGNGTYTLQVIARDVTGHQVVLGTVTVKGDNANAEKPFGAIDTPTQGGIASGSSFINYGWVLTPTPNRIPSDGTTIDVYIDGIKKGHPVYNNYRKDIATLFPGYTNSNGAVGYYYIDTTKLDDGVHTIEWSARDSANNIDGIGSRYFTVQNGSARSTVYGQGLEGNGFAGIQSGDSMLKGKIARFKRDIINPVIVSKGYDHQVLPLKVFPTKSGTVHITIEEMQRVVIDFFHDGIGSAGGKMGNTFKREMMNLFPLPIGASIDSKNGKFYWQPGLAFKGEFHFDFLIRQADGKQVKKQVNIEIR